MRARESFRRLGWRVQVVAQRPATVGRDFRRRYRLLVKRILRKHGYPPDKQEKTTQTVLEQAEVLSGTWAS